LLPVQLTLDPSRHAGAGGADRTTLRASSVAQLGGAGATSATTLTLSIEQSVLRQRFATDAVGSASPGGRYPTVVDDVARATNHNTGMLAQVSTAWRDALFVTGGLRLERNDAFSGEDRYPLLPLIGAAWVRSLGPIEVKLRSSYGKGIRPPLTTVRGSWGEPTSPVSARPGLDPERRTRLQTPKPKTKLFTHRNPKQKLLQTPKPKTISHTETPNTKNDFTHRNPKTNKPYATRPAPRPSTGSFARPRSDWCSVFVHPTRSRVRTVSAFRSRC
jgi:hypothetical protein